MDKSKITLATIAVAACFVIGKINGFCAEKESPLCWPPPPAEIRINFIQSVYCAADLGMQRGFFKKLKGMLFGEETNAFNKPLAVAVDKHKTIYICDAGGPAVHIFTQKNKRYKKITSINKQELLSPVGIAVSDNDLVFIADSSLKKVFCLDNNARFKFSIGSDTTFLRPTGLALYKEKLFIADTLRHRIMIFDTKGNFIGSFGGRGKQEGAFNFPTSIATDSDGNLYVTDTLNFRIQIFDKNNRFLYSIGSVGDSTGTFARPKGVAVDSFGHIYATDGVFDNIQIFSRKKEFLLSLGVSGHEDGEFWIPSGIAIDSENYIYVADSYNQRIQILRYVGRE